MALNSGMVFYTVLKNSRFIILVGVILLVACGLSRTENGCASTVKEKESMIMTEGSLARKYPMETAVPAGLEMATFGMG
jgi:hypothetical protein